MEIAAVGVAVETLLPWMSADGRTVVLFNGTSGLPPRKRTLDTYLASVPQPCPFSPPIAFPFPCIFPRLSRLDTSSIPQPSRKLPHRSSSPVIISVRNRVLLVLALLRIRIRAEGDAGYRQCRCLWNSWVAPSVPCASSTVRGSAMVAPECRLDARTVLGRQTTER